MIFNCFQHFWALITSGDIHEVIWGLKNKFKLGKKTPNQLFTDGNHQTPHGGTLSLYDCNTVSYFFALKIVKHKQTEFIEERRSPSCFYSRDEPLAALNSDLSSSSSACPALDGFSVVAVWRKAISGHWCMRRALLFVVLSFGVHLSTRYDKISRYCADFSFTFYPLQASQSEDKISLFVRCRFVCLWASVSYHSFNKRL